MFDISIRYDRWGYQMTSNAIAPNRSVSGVEHIYIEAPVNMWEVKDVTAA